MNNPVIILTTDDEFSLAMTKQTPVIVWQEKRLIGYGDKINSFNDFSVTIDGDHYVRSVCEFRLK
jgi:hypothetical protein